MSNVIDLVKSLMPDDFFSKATSAFGESDESVKKAMSAGIPAILAGLLSKSETTEGAHALHKLATEAAGGPVVSSLFPEDATHMSPGMTNILNGISKLLGDRWASIISMIGNFAGIKPHSATGLTEVLTSLVLPALGQKSKSENLSASGLATWLMGQKEHIVEATPPGFDLASALGLSSLGSLGLGAANMASGVKKPDDSPVPSLNTPENKKGNKWLLPFLILLALGAIVWYLKSGKKTDEAGRNTGTTIMAPETAPTVRTLKEISLPDGTKLQAYPGGIENKLLKFIQSDEYKNASDDHLKDKWFNFDDLNFEFGTTTLTSESKRQFDNIVVILKAFPDVKIKIGCYTDRKGNDTANKKLSDERAKAVQKALQNAGVGTQVPEAEGYGEEFAAVDENASDDARMSDRKTAVRLLK